MAQSRSTAKKPSARKDTAKPKAAPKRQGAATPKRKPAAARRTRKAPSPPASAVNGTIGTLPPELVQNVGGHERVALILADVVPQDASTSDVLRLLTEAVRLGADPLRRDVYLTAGASRDGGEREFSVAAKRDALLAYAERQPSFRGFQADAVYAGDKFAIGKPDPDAGPDDLAGRAGISHERVYGDERGQAERAWCVVEREGRPLVWFVAERAEYLPDDLFDALDPDDARRRYPDRYLVKAAMCWPLRMVFALNDVVGAEELLDRRAAAPVADPQSGDVLPGLDGADELDQRILALYGEAHRLDPVAWPPAKIRARLLGAPDVEARQQLAADLSDTLANRIDEMIAFDPSTLDEDALREFAQERARLDYLLEGPGAAEAETVVAAA